MEYIKKQLDMLRCLLLGEKSFSQLKKALGYNDMTLSRHLKYLESKSDIAHDHLKRTYRITPKGKFVLDELDIETKGNIFSVLIFTDIELVFDHYFIFDARLPDNIFDELFNKSVLVIECLERHDQENLIVGELKLQKQYQQALASLKLSLPTPLEYKLRPEFSQLISKTISDAIIYLSIKSLETGKGDILGFLSALPSLLVYQIAKTGLSDEELKKGLLNVNILEDYYITSQTITPGNYKKVMDAFSGENIPTYP